MNPGILIAELQDSRRMTRKLVANLDGEQWFGPQLKIVNPPLWELGHVAWFCERWVLRHACGHPPLHDDGDALYNSSDVVHDDRWELSLPNIEATVRYFETVHDTIIACLGDGPVDERLEYLCRLVTYHEDMHAEAFLYTHQTLGYAPPDLGPSTAPGGGGLEGDVEIPGGEFPLGASTAEPFVFDNEKWAHPVAVAPFRIARAPVTEHEFLAFVEDDGYRRRELWSDAGWQWRQQAGAEHPSYWQREPSGRWLHRWFDEHHPLREHRPVLHVNWFEAEAYCRWAERRLPTEAEWELAASGFPEAGRKRRFPWGDDAPGSGQAHLEIAALDCADVGACSDGDSPFGCRQLIGNVWEWTRSTFEPFPGFEIDPYEDYSKPWFGTRKVLRGGSFATAGRMLRNTWRNYFTPDRSDVFAGFRTVAL